MTFRVIDGGRNGEPKSQPAAANPLEAARRAVIDRVASAIWDAESAGVQPWPEFTSFAADAYASGDPAMLVQVSETYQKARAAIAAMAPIDQPPLLDEIGVQDAGLAAAMIEDWVKAVLA